MTDIPREQEPDGADEPTTGVPAGAGRPANESRTGAVAASPRADADRRQRNRRRWLVAGIVAAAAIVAVALCAGVLGVISVVSGVRDRAAVAREDRRQQDTACLDLERRLNHLIPPGAAGTPPARASAIRNENAAVRIYVAVTPSTREQDAWRQLLDARTAYAEALDQQAKARTPAFFVAPKASDGSAVSDQLIRWSPASCAGTVRRLAAPDL